MPSDPGAVSEDAAQALIEKLKAYQDTSLKEMRRAQAKGNRIETASRKAEACTLNVCIDELLALAAVRSPGGGDK